MTNRVAAHYSALVSGEPIPLSESGACLDLLAREKMYAESSAHTRDRAFWRGRLNGWTDAATFSGKAPERTGDFLRQAEEIPASIATRLREMASANKASPPQLLIAAAVTYLAHVSGSPRPTLGVAASGRNASSRKIVGMSANVLPLCLEIGPGESVGKVLEKTAAAMRGMARHQRYRGEDVRRDLGLRPSDPDNFGTI